VFGVHCQQLLSHLDFEHFVDFADSLLVPLIVVPELVNLDY